MVQPQLDVDQQLLALIRRKTKKEIDFATTLADAGLDSLDIIEIAFDIEDAFRIKLPQSQQEMASFTFRDLCGLVQEQLAAQADASSDPSAPVSSQGYVSGARVGQ